MPTVLITGGHSGLGLECATWIAGNARLNLVLLGCDLDEMGQAAKRLRTDHGIAVYLVECDLASLAAVRAAAASCIELLESGQIDSLQAMICNAGGQFQGPVSYSAEGYEETFALNCLGHFLLVNLLLDRLSSQGRIVFTASGAHDPDTIDAKLVGKAIEPDAEMLATQGKNGEPLASSGVRFSTSQLCLILYAYELDRKLRTSGSSLVSIAFDPGFIPETDLSRDRRQSQQPMMKMPLIKRLFRWLGVTRGSLAFSGAELAKVAVAPSFASSSGKYLQCRNGTLAEATSSGVSYDQSLALKLWMDSRRLVRLRGDEEPRLFR